MKKLPGRKSERERENGAVSRQPIFASIDVKQGKARYTHLINHTHTERQTDTVENTIEARFEEREKTNEQNQVHEVQMEEELTIG